MKAMEDRMDLMMNDMKGGTATLDNLVHCTTSPFMAQVTSCPLSPKFRMPSLETHDGMKDPLDHLESFKTLMHLEGILDEIMFQAFPTTLKGSARVWFSKIKPISVSIFKELSNNFVTHFIRGKRHKHSTHALMQIRQREDESLRSYVAQFNKEALLINEMDEMVLVTAISSGLKEREFFFFVLRDKSKTIANILF